MEDCILDAKDFERAPQHADPHLESCQDRTSYLWNDNFSEVSAAFMEGHGGMGQDERMALQKKRAHERIL